MSKKNPLFVLDKPIDFVALEKAYSECRWRWSRFGPCGRSPSADDITSMIVSLTQSAKQNNGFCSCGGLTVRIVSGEQMVAIHPNLHAQLPVSTPGKFDPEF